MDNYQMFDQEELSPYPEALKPVIRALMAQSKVMEAPGLSYGSDPSTMAPTQLPADLEEEAGGHDADISRDVLPTPVEQQPEVIPDSEELQQPTTISPAGLIGRSPEITRTYSLEVLLAAANEISASPVRASTPLANRPLVEYQSTAPGTDVEDPRIDVTFAQFLDFEQPEVPSSDDMGTDTEGPANVAFVDQEEESDPGLDESSDEGSRDSSLVVSTPLVGQAPALPQPTIQEPAESSGEDVVIPDSQEAEEEEDAKLVESSLPLSLSPVTPAVNRLGPPVQEQQVTPVSSKRRLETLGE